MAWGQSLILIDNVADDAATTAEATSPACVHSVFPFDATLYEPMVKPVESMPTVAVVDQREREREEVKACLQGILRNRLLSESARVSAARELTRIFDNEEISELREEVKRLTAIIEANAPDESDLPPHLQRKRR
jgi:hypothetical protein